MPGLITSDLPNDKKIMAAQTAPYDAVTRTVNPNETVSAQLDRILAKGGPTMDRARAGSVQTANSRGLLNSSIAATAGEAAVIDAALPIATADANTYGTASRDNQSYQNTAGQFNAGATNTANLNAAAAGNQSLLTSQAGEETRATQAAAGDIQARIATLQGQIQTGLIGEQGAQTRMTAAQADAAQKELVKLQGEIQTAQIQETGAQQRQTAAQVASAQESQARLQSSLDAALQTLKGEQAKALSDTEAQYRTTIQTSASAATLFTTFTNALTVSQSDANTTPEQKAAAAATLTNMLKSGLAVIGGAGAADGNIDLTTLLTFDTSPIPAPAPPPAAAQTTTPAAAPAAATAFPTGAGKTLQDFINYNRSAAPPGYPQAASDRDAQTQWAEYQRKNSPSEVVYGA